LKNQSARNEHVTCIVINSNTDELVLIEDVTHKFPLLKLPGGGVKNEETALQAIIREVLEETGLTIKPEDVRLLSKQTTVSAGSKHSTCTFVATIENYDNLHRVAVVDGDATLEVRVMKGESLNESHVVPTYWKILTTGIKKIREEGM